MSSETQLTTETKQATSGAETWPKVAIIVLNWNGWRRHLLLVVLTLGYLTFQRQKMRTADVVVSENENNAGKTFLMNPNYLEA